MSFLKAEIQIKAINWLFNVLILKKFENTLIKEIDILI